SRVAGAIASRKAKRLVEPCRREIVCSQMEVVESPAGCLDNMHHQLATYSASAECRCDVQMPDPADPLTASIRIDIQPADPNQQPVDPRAEQSLSWPVEPIGRVAPR